MGLPDYCRAIAYEKFPVSSEHTYDNSPPLEGWREAPGFERPENSPADCFQRERADRPLGKG
jgi:hypothetical protein